MSEATISSASAMRCMSCGTELAPHALACPYCQTLIYGDRLKQLAATAEQHEAAGNTEQAVEQWNAALRLLPTQSAQHETIRRRVSALAVARTQAPASKPANPNAPAWRRWASGVGATLLIVLGKLKFLILGLTKLSTLLSMFAFFGVYWHLYGWPLAAGLVISIYIHEMGHVMEIKHLGLAAGAPVFIPGLGALVMLKQHVDDPVVDARIGLGGPVWGALAAMTAFVVFLITKSNVWAAIAQLAAWINLFNLLPVWQLNGSRDFHALDRNGRLVITAACVALAYITSQKLLLLIAAVAAFRAFQPVVVVKSDRRTLATFALLLAVLSGLAAISVAR
jgi:Zn-dependent protease